MAREHLEKRAEWQKYAAARGQGAEEVFTAVMSLYLEGSGFLLEHKPKALKGIYGTRTTGKQHGIIPEFMIRNPQNERAVFVEIKRQRAAGNAHERACKYMMPGIVEAMRQVGNQPPGVLPMWWIFTNGIASDKNYRQEISFWFRGIERNLMFWEDVKNPSPVIEHYERDIRPMLAP